MNTISLKIRLLDKEFQVNCKPDERAALEASAQLLNKKMQEIRRGSNIVGLERISVMAALNLAHDLLQANNTASESGEASQRMSVMESKLDAVLTDLGA